ncbi:hypothetical protein RQP46_009617 [Phenoliferia psychrophenolica]
MATIDSLPNETLDKIMEMLKTPYRADWENRWLDETGRNDMLQSAALVCSRWRDPAQRALFSDVHISSYNHPLRHDRFLAAPAHLRRQTRSLRVIYRDKKRWPEVVEMTGGITQLSVLDEDGGEMMNWGELARLKHLSVMSPEYLEDPVDVKTLLPMRLSSLGLWLVSDTPSFKFIDAILSTSAETLETLHLRIAGLRSEACLHPTLRLVGPRLTTLILDASYDVFDGNEEFLTYFTGLKSLAWHAHDDEAEFSSAHLLKILAALPSPPTLSSLSLDTNLKYMNGEDSLTLEELDSIINHPAVTQLVELHLHEWRAFAERDAMAQACEDRGIKLIMEEMEERV